MMKKRTALIISFSLTFLFTAYNELSLRSYLYKHSVKPHFLADSLPNFLGVVLLSLLFSIIEYKKATAIPLNPALKATLSMVLYEFAQFLIPGRTFDIQDIAASILGGILSYLFLLLIFKHCKSEKKIY